MKVKSLVAPTKVETMTFNEIEALLQNYLQPTERLIIQQTNIVASTQRSGESSDLPARLKEAADFVKLET